MKFEISKMASMVFNTGRDFLSAAEVYNNDTKIKSVEDEKERFSFELPMSFGDIKKLFDLEIDTDMFNPLKKDNNLALGIKDEKVLSLLKGAKDTFSSLEEKIEQMKSKIVEDMIVLPDELNTDNIVIKKCFDEIKDLIKDKASEKISVVKFVDRMNDFKENLNTALETSEKVVQFLSKENLFDKDLLNVPKELEAEVIKKKEQLIEKTKTVMRDIEDIANTFDDFMSYADKKQAFNNMFTHEVNEEVTRRI